MKFFVIYLVIGWVLSMINVVIAIIRYPNYEMFDDDEKVDDLIMIAYWLPLLLTLAIGYGAKGIAYLVKKAIKAIKKAITYIKAKRNGNEIESEE